jgi:arsenate reductase
MLKILFLCTGNSCRSQMAEAWARHLKGNAIKPFSAGVEKHGLDPLAVKVMAEVGLDLSNQKSKLVGELEEQEFDYVVTLCDNARESCPLFAGDTRIIHQGFDNPPTHAAQDATENAKLDHYRRVRDEIRAFVERLPEALAELDLVS